MPDNAVPAPRLIPGIMLSSTFKDLKDHRVAFMEALRGQGLAEIAMENDSAKPGVDLIDSSLRMVQDASAYIVIISRRYGQTPNDPVRNPKGLSITELEFNEAQRLGRPILLFIMGAKHQLTEADIELDAENRKKLDAFRERAKKISPKSLVDRVYAEFNSLEEFTKKAIHAAAELRRYLDKIASPPPPAPQPAAPQAPSIPAPPALYAEPRYIVSRDFVGRRDQLETLNEWALPADPHPVLLFDAIGGTGKSMLTWEWATNHAAKSPTKWSGRFWYSFYERGAIMADFCRHALAYITGQPLESFKTSKTPEMAERLLRHLQQGDPWLLVLDGVERVLVAYQRSDAAQLADEDANSATDQIAQRDPCSAIRPEDDDLLRSLAAAAPSKILITSRLVPRVLLNQTGLAIPGVLRVSLPCLRPAAAEELLRACGVKGDSQAIQNYLKSNCDCHPLVTGVLAGLILNYLPDRGNFDKWVADDKIGGARLNLADLDLIQKRNHILNASIDALSQESKGLLSTLALVSESVDYATLAAIAPQGLSNSVRDLEQRGLLQYDPNARRYDLHPVVRSVASGRLSPKGTEQYGQPLVDHFSSRPHNPYDQAETLDDVCDGLNLVRTLLKMGRHQQACDAFTGGLSHALFFNLQADPEALSLLKPFFTHGWAALPDIVLESDAAYLANVASIALATNDMLSESTAASGVAFASYVRHRTWPGAHAALSNLSSALRRQDRLAKEARSLLLGLDLATLMDDDEPLFMSGLASFSHFVLIGNRDEAQQMWRLLATMGRRWSRASYRPGDAEAWYAAFCFWQGQLTEPDLACADQLARSGKSRTMIRDLCALRAEWHIERQEWPQASQSLAEAVSMDRAIGKAEPEAETLLALAKFHLGQLPDPRLEAEQLANVKQPAHLALAQLRLALGDRDQAKKHALAAYTEAWADGEPYVNRYRLSKTRAILETLGVEIPVLPPYDSAKDGKFPMEDEITAAIEKLRAEKESQSSGSTKSKPSRA